MVVKLPTSSGAAFGSGGRARRVERIPTAADVPQVQTQPDPGLPEIVAPRGAFGGGLGAGLEQAGASIANLGFQVKERQEGLARDRDQLRFQEAVVSTVQQLEESGADFSDESVTKAAIENLEAEKQRIVEQHRGSAFSKQRLSATLDQLSLRATTELTAKRIAAARDQTNEALSRTINGVVAEALDDPSVPISSRFAQYQEKVDDLGLTGQQREKALIGGREQIAAAIISDQISRGTIDPDTGLMVNAREALDSPEIADALTPSVRVGLLERIRSVENAVNKAGLQARQQVDFFMEMGSRLGLDGDDLDDFVLSMLVSNDAGSTENERAMARLVGKGVLDRDTADKILGGTLRLANVPDPRTGQITSVVVDLSNVGSGGQTISPNTPFSAVPGGQPPATPSPAAPQAAPEAPGAQPTPAEAASTQPAEPPARQPAQEAEAKPAQTLFEAITGPTAVTGVVPALLEGAQRVVGQFGVRITKPEQQKLRKRFSNLQTALAEALVPNTRFPTKQVELVLEKADIEPSMLTDRQTLLTNMLALDEELKRRQADAETDANDTTLPADVRRDQARNARALANFRSALGIPEGFTTEDIKNIPQPTEGGIGDTGNVIEGVGEFLSDVFGDRGGATVTPSPAAGVEIPAPAEIAKMTVEEVRRLAETAIENDVKLTHEQVVAIRDKLLKSGDESQ